MKKDWKKERAKGARHARLMAKRPELRAALYGKGRRSVQDTLDAVARETAHFKDQDNG